MTRWNSEGNEGMHERYDRGMCTNGLKAGVVEWVERNTLRWFGHIDRMKNENWEKMYMSETESPNRKGRPPGRWKDRVGEYMSERGLEQAKRKCLDKEK